MGQAVTEAGAISAVAAFFRQKLDACAWTENASAASAAATAPTAVPPFTASATGTPPPPPPPLLRLPLSASGGAASADYREGGVPSAPPRPPLELVVSRGPGPAFSASETRVAEQAAALLRQAIARVRDRGSLAAAEAALENSLRGMQEASAAVAALVGERERRAEHQERQRADAAEEHGRALSTAAAELTRARAETEGFRRRLVEAEEAVTIVAGAANALCRRAASERNGNVFWGGEGEGVGEGVGAAAEIGELVAEAERAARKSLRCFFARVERAVQGKAAVPTAAHRGSGGDASPGARESLREPLRAGEHRGVEEDRARNLNMRVPVPHFGCDPVAAPLVLSLRRRSRESGFTKGDERLASVLAACLSTAMSTLHEKRHSLMCARKTEADRKARAGHKETAGAAAAAASAEARERRDRAIAGTRALAAAAQASEARAESGAEATAHAERQTEALRHLLSGLGAAGGDHAAVAEVVAERAAAAVPKCVSAVLLTPRQGNGRGGRYATAPPPPRPRVDAGVGGGGGGGGGSSLMFSPDPRVWAAGASEKRRGRGGFERNGDRGKMSRWWAEAVGRAASQAASTGKTVCVTDGAVDTTLGPEAGAASQVFVACFSPLCASSPASACESESKTSAFGAKENLRPAGSGVAVGTNAVPGQQVWPSRGADRSVCVIAWMLSLGSRVPDADGDRRTNARSARSFDQTSTTAAAAAAAAAADAAAAGAGAAEGMTMTTPPPTLPPWVSAAMEGVAHAVGLAVSSATAGDGFDMIGHSRSAGFGAANGRGGLVAASFSGSSITMDAFRSRTGGNGLPFGGRSEEDNNSRDEDLARLREGTSALSGRVQMLEKRAAGLRASEARSAAALARARSDAMAVKGQLQLAGLERDRLLSRLQETEGRVVQGEVGVGRRPLTAARSRANHRLDDAVPTLGWREGEGRPASATMSAWGQSKERTGIVGAVATSARARPEGGGRAAHGVSVHGGVGTAGAAATASSAEGKVAAAATRYYCGGGETPRRFDSPEAAGADDASSQALQRMASLHARLSDSLRRGGVSARTDEQGKKERQA